VLLTFEDEDFDCVFYYSSITEGEEICTKKDFTWPLQEKNIPVGETYLHSKSLYALQFI
jgi:hypothetical protein